MTGLQNMTEYLRGAGPFLPGLVPFFLLTQLSCSTLAHYTVQTEDLISQFESGSLGPAFEEARDRSRNGPARLAYLLEGAMILHTVGRPQESNAAFEEAEQVIRHHEEKADLSLSRGTAQVGSLFVNEKTLPYQGEPFEKVLVNTCKAANYLFLHDFEAARVESLRSFARQRENEERHRKEVERLEEEAEERGVSPCGVIRSVNDHYEDQREIVRRVKNLYEDAFTYYLSAIVYELNAEYNDAYIDLKKVQELRPGVACVENDLLRMALRSGLPDELKRWMTNLGRTPRLLDAAQEGEVLIIFGCGMAPRKTETKIPVLVPALGIVTVALPKYERLPNPVEFGALYDRQGRLHGRTFVLTDLEAVAIRSLADRMAALALKQVLRSTVKGGMAQAAGDGLGWPAGVVANLYNVITEQADLRCWQTLPQNLQVARIPLPAGSHRLTFALHGGTGARLEERTFSLHVRPGEKIFVNARSGMRGLIGFGIFQVGPDAVNEVQQGPAEPIDSNPGKG